MGTFRIVITGVGSHGQDRGKKNGEIVDFNEGGDNTPDAQAKKFVEQLIATNQTSISEAKIIHWPGQESEVIDDLLTGTRTGNF